IEIAAPFPELFYNRAELRLALGQAGGALADLTYLLEMEPDFTEGRVSRATLLLDAGEVDSAEADVRTGLAGRPEEPRLLCLLGRIEQERGALDEARAAFDRALLADPACAPALVDRATLAYLCDDLDAAAADLTAALELLGDDPDVLYNRAVVYQDRGRFADAVADYDRAMTGAGMDTTELRSRREECRAALVGPAGGREGAA